MLYKDPKDCQHTNQDLFPLLCASGNATTWSEEAARGVAPNIHTNKYPTLKDEEFCFVTLGWKEGDQHPILRGASDNYVQIPHRITTVEARPTPGATLRWMACGTVQ